MNRFGLQAGERIGMEARALLGGAPAPVRLYLAGLKLYPVYLRGSRTEGKGPPG
jgi:hypothetical protein